MRRILGILGCTGVGKSKVAVKVAKLLDGIIVSADSMQVYKGMDVGTAKITADEMDGVQHFMLDVVECDQPYSAVNYAEDVKKVLEDNPFGTPILAGGTGFYFDSLFLPFDFENNEQTLLVRKEMQDLYENQGKDALLQVLEKVDPTSFETIDKNNIKRVIRAIEIASSGQLKSQGTRNSRKEIMPKLLFVLTRPRQQIVEATATRVDKMFEMGLVEEVQSLYEKFDRRDQLQSFQAIGYKEIISYLKGECSLEEAKEQIKIATRQYAKRQTTYFKRMDAEFIDVEQFANLDEIAQYIADKYKNAN
ncbi:MAG: tRNA (adenosine(37)-N6)-dimethylallyltransferase MiaA [Clostridia bacterium]|nr:tRNA (adenosine(37)-N6)-dimethylallyltransferase MiaA [Clostridia bacterium]